MDEQLALLVGQRIRRLREQTGLSLRKQAALAEVAPSALSALENGRGGMSLSSLQRVATQFGISITELLAAPAPTDSETQFATSEIFPNCTATPNAVQRGKGVLYQLLGPGNGHLLQPYVLSFLPGGGFSRDQIGHAGEEFVYVILGEVELLLGEDVNKLQQGDAMRFRTETPHSFRNTSATGIAFVVGAATPPW
jgi:transcriptional regulator with XRE-family HTH domain/mannose-6-phosphate isomerase-like protein (cupin superfamily)